MELAWYEFAYTIDPLADEPIMLINTHIGFDETDGMGVNSALFQQELLKLDAAGKTRIKVIINSLGGVVMEGMAIYNAILKTKTPVDTYNGGIAASIAAVIFLAGKVRYMADYSMLMFHDPYTVRDRQEDNSQIDAFRKAIITMIATRVNKSDDDISALMHAAQFMDAETARSQGYCHVIENSTDLNKKRLMPGGDIAAMWKDSNLILNKIFIKDDDMKEILGVLNLTPVVGDTKATETAAVEAIGKIKNELTTATTELTTVNTKVTTLETEKTELAQKIADKDAEITALQTEKTTLTADLATKTETAATSMVEEAFNSGKITEESKVDWIAKAKTDLDGVKNQLASITINKVAPKINLAASKVITGAATVANKMEEIRAKQGY